MALEDSSSLILAVSVQVRDEELAGVQLVGVSFTINPLMPTIFICVHL